MRSTRRCAAASIGDSIRESPVAKTPRRYPTNGLHTHHHPTGGRLMPKTLAIKLEDDTHAQLTILAPHWRRCPSLTPSKRPSMGTSPPSAASPS